MPQLANSITFARMVLAPAVAAALLVPAPIGPWAAFVLFVIAAFSDLLDGHIARLLNQASALGRILDPVADKLLVSAGFIVLAANGALDAPHMFAAIIILGREFLVAGLRETLAGRQVFAPTTLAKWKSAIQMIAIGSLLFALAESPVAHLGQLLGHTLLWIAAGLALASAWQYVRAAWDSLRG